VPRRGWENSMGHASVPQIQMGEKPDAAVSGKRIKL